MKPLPALLLLTLGFSPLASVAEIPVHRFSEAPHGYYTRPPTDAFTQVLNRIRLGQITLDPGDEKTQLRSLLKTLRIPESSQLLVYSATSLQSGLILPSNPRAIYFNDEAYVGYVPGGRFEIASIDPALGPIFYLVKVSGDGRPEATRSERCMNCHAGRTSWGVPGFVAESVLATATSGASLDGFRREIAGHTIPVPERLGGWHVTGAQANAAHLGNLLAEAIPDGYRKFPNPPGRRFDWNRYPAATSDLFAHLLLEHQIGFHNLITLGTYRTRDALAAGAGAIRPEDRGALDEIAWRIVRYLLFENEAALPAGGVQPDPTLLKDFLAQRKTSANGASLRDPELATRLFRFRCSYMIYSPGFSGLPAEMQRRVFQGLGRALKETGAPVNFDYLPGPEKRAIREILQTTGIPIGEGR